MTLFIGIFFTVCAFLTGTVAQADTLRSTASTPYAVRYTLTLEQFVKMPQSERTTYIANVGLTVKIFESMQNKLRPHKKHASLWDLINSPAYAEIANFSFKKGEACLDGGTFGVLTSDNGDCPTTPCQNGEQGQQCGLVTYGVNACVPAGRPMIVECAKKAETSYFRIQSDATYSEIRRLIYNDQSTEKYSLNDLLKYSVDPVIFQEMIVRAKRDRDAGKEITNKVLSTALNDWTRFGSSFDSFANEVNRYCDKMAGDFSKTPGKTLSKEESYARGACEATKQRLAYNREQIAVFEAKKNEPPPVELAAKCPYSEGLQDNMKCVACALNTYPQYGRVDKSNGPHKISDKWMSLIQVMAKTCGSDAATSNAVDSARLLEFVNTFGYCSESTYGWRSSDEARAVELVRWHAEGNAKLQETTDVVAWFNRQFRDECGGRSACLYHTHAGKAFREIYGISLGQAKDFFCHDSQSPGAARAAFLKELNSTYDGTKQKERYTKNGIGACLAEAAIAQSNLSSNNGNNLCLTMGVVQPPINAIEQINTRQATLVTTANGTCATAQGVIAEGNPAKIKSLYLVDSRNVAEVKNLPADNNYVTNSAALARCQATPAAAPAVPPRSRGWDRETGSGSSTHEDGNKRHSN